MTLTANPNLAAYRVGDVVNLFADEAGNEGDEVTFTLVDGAGTEHQLASGLLDVNGAFGADCTLPSITPQAGCSFRFLNTAAQDAPSDFGSFTLSAAVARHAASLSIGMKIGL